MSELPPRELRHLADNVAVMVTSCTRDLRYRFVNVASAKFLGRPSDEIVGRPIVEVLGADAFDAIRPYVDRVLGGERVEYESEIPHARPGARTMKVVYVPERDDSGDVTGWVAAIFDVSEQKRAERALRDADQRKNDFISTLAHELRNPLAPIRSSLELARRANYERATVRDAHATIARQVAAITRMVDELLDGSRIAQDRTVRPFRRLPAIYSER